MCIALLGILVLGFSFLNGLAVASALTVVCTVLAAVTLLPALLGVFRMRVLSRRQRRRLPGQGTGASQGEHGGRAVPPYRGVPGGRPRELTLWARWAATVQRRPAVLAAAAAAVMLVLAIPVLHLRLGSSDQGNDPSSSTTRQAYDLLADGFGPGFNGPLLLVAQTSSPADAAALRALETGLPHVADVDQRAHARRGRWHRGHPGDPGHLARGHGDLRPDHAPCATTPSRPPSAGRRCGSTSAASPPPSRTSPRP